MDPATLEHLIIKDIRKAKEISRRDLAETLGIAKSTAGRRVDSLIERGLIREIGVEDRKEAGRPRRFLALRGEYGSFIGIDFDARHLFAVLIDFSQATVAKKKVRFPAEPERDGVLSSLRETIAELRETDASPPILGIGIGVPGHIHREARIGFGYPFIDNWTNVDLPGELGIEPGSLHIENNTRAVALGEYWLGPHAAANNLVCINVRTGISAAVIANGALLTGSHEMAGEIRSWPALVSDGGSTVPGTLEDIASVRAVTTGNLKDEATWSEFVSDCHGGDSVARKTLSKLAILHGDTVARLVQLLDPDVVFLSGPFTAIGDLYLDLVRDAAAQALKQSYFSPPPILPATLGEFAGAHGAAALAASECRLA